MQMIRSSMPACSMRFMIRSRGVSGSLRIMTAKTCVSGAPRIVAAVEATVIPGATSLSIATIT